MFHLCMFLFSAVLFFALTPGVLVSLPPKGKKYTVAAVHAVIFAVVWHFTHKAGWYLTEGFYAEQVNQSPQVYDKPFLDTIMKNFQSDKSDTGNTTLDYSLVSQPQDNVLLSSSQVQKKPAPVRDTKAQAAAIRAAKIAGGVFCKNKNTKCLD